MNRTEPYTRETMHNYIDLYTDAEITITVRHICSRQGRKINYFSMRFRTPRHTVRHIDSRQRSKDQLLLYT